MITGDPQEPNDVHNEAPEEMLKTCNVPHPCQFRILPSLCKYLKYCDYQCPRDSRFQYEEAMHYEQCYSKTVEMNLEDAICLLSRWRSEANLTNSQSLIDDTIKFLVENKTDRKDKKNINR